MIADLGVLGYQIVQPALLLRKKRPLQLKLQ